MHAERLKQQGRLFPALHLRDAHLDPSSARVRVVRGVDPAHPFPARHRGDLVPQVLDLLRGSCQSGRKIPGHARLRPFPAHLDVKRRGVTRADASIVLQRVIDPHPVARISVWLEHRLELGAIDRSAHRHLPARWQLLARRLRQPHHRRCADRGQRGVISVPLRRGLVHGQPRPAVSAGSTVSISQPAKAVSTSSCDAPPDQPPPPARAEARRQLRWPRGWPVRKHPGPRRGAVRHPGPGSSRCRGRSRTSLGAPTAAASRHRQHS